KGCTKESLHVPPVIQHQLIHPLKITLLVKPSIFIHKAFVAYHLYIFHKCLLKLSHIGSELQFLVYNSLNNIKLRTTGSFLRIYAISLPRSSDTSPFMNVFLVKFCRKSIPFFWSYALFRKH